MYNLQFKFSQGLVITRQAVVSMRLFHWFSFHYNKMREIQNFEYAIPKLPFAFVSKWGLVQSLSQIVKKIKWNENEHLLILHRKKIFETTIRIEKDIIQSMTQTTRKKFTSSPNGRRTYDGLPQIGRTLYHWATQETRRSLDHITRFKCDKPFPNCTARISFVEMSEICKGKNDGKLSLVLNKKDSVSNTS